MATVGLSVPHLSIVIGGNLFNRRETEMFNGYSEQVAHLYAGMDLIENH